MDQLHIFLDGEALGHSRTGHLPFGLLQCILRGAILEKHLNASADTKGINVGHPKNGAYNGTCAE